MHIATRQQLCSIALRRSVVLSQLQSQKKASMTAMSTSASLATNGLSGKELYYPSRPRRFAPLNPELKSRSSGDGAPPLKGIIFDVDGTLCLPQNYMFREMRAVLGIDKSTDILDHIRTLSDEPDDSETSTDKDTQQRSSTNDSEAKSSPRARASESIRQIERNAMSTQKPQPGLVELMTYLESRKLSKALCTRNFPAPVEHLITTFLFELKDGFDTIITRETKGIEPKPSPEGLWKIAQNWKLDQEPRMKEALEHVNTSDHQSTKSSSDVLEVAKRVLGEGLIMVGDSIDDMASGYRAGAATVLLVNEDNEHLTQHEYTDLSIRRLDELVDVLENGFVGKT